MAAPEAIPHQDPWLTDSRIERGFFRELRALYRASAFCGGEYVERFEREFGRYLGASRVTAVNSGTSAVHLALAALGIGPGDDVVVPAYTFAGSVWGVLYCGARPVFADVDPGTGNLDPASVEKVWTRRTRALIAVHLFGRPAPLPELLALVRDRRAFLVEDAAQAHGAALGGKRLGTWGDMGCFSFYPTKNLGGCGEGGAVAAARKVWADRIRLLRNHNSPRRGEYAGLGFNHRMGGIQALFLGLKLPQLDALNAERRSIAKFYLECLADSPIRPLGRDAEESVWQSFVCRIPGRGRRAFLAYLDGLGIGHAVHYPKILPGQPPFGGRGPATRAHFPGAADLAQSAVSLPLYPGLKKAQARRIGRALAQWRELAEPGISHFR